MGRMKDREFQIIKKIAEQHCYNYYTSLVAHCEAIELELKISKEDEQRALDAMNRLMDNVAQLSNEKDGLLKEIFTMQEEVLKLREIVRDNTWYDQYKKQIRDSGILRERVVELEQENKRLMNEVDEARAAWLELEKQVPKKVVLPKEVAEALDSYKTEGHDGYFIMRTIAMNSGEGASDRLKTLKNYAYHYGYEFITALAHGYTVEKTKEERLREGIKEIYDNFDISNEEVIDRLTDFVTKFNAEN